RVAHTGLPKLYSPVAAGALGGPIRFQARLSSSRPWTVTVTDASGAVVATHKGSGATIDWTWVTAGKAGGGYRWSIDAGKDVFPAGGAFGPAPLPAPVTAPPLATGPLLSGLSVAPGVASPNTDGTNAYVTADFTVAPTLVSPNGDGTADAATVAFNLSQAVPVQLVLQQLGTTIGTISAATLGPGPQSIVWNGTINGNRVPDGVYQLTLVVSG